MHRLVALLIALLMPLQLVWAAAAVYCGHELSSGRPAQVSPHFGHHEHVHADHAQPAAKSPLQADHDCGACHASCTAAIVALDGLPDPALMPRLALPPAAAPPMSAPSRAPDRPQWRCLA